MILAGDIGGTKVLLQLSSTGAGGVLLERRYLSSKYAGLVDVIRAFLAEYAAAGGPTGGIQSACFGIAGPVSGERVKVTNLPWQIDARELARALNIPAVKLVNDFEAAVHGIEALADNALVTLQPGEADAQGHRVVVGAGTGFGVAYSVWTGTGYRAIAGEGGHMGYAPQDSIQAALWQAIRDREGRVTVEHVVSGPGLVRVYDFFLRRDGAHAPPISPSVDTASIIAGAREGDVSAQAALDLFIASYGAVAGDHALAMLARGGVYVCGGIAPAILPQLAAGRFLASFKAKGVHAGLMRLIPVHVVTDPNLGLHGARVLAGRLSVSQ